MKKFIYPLFLVIIFGCQQAEKRTVVQLSLAEVQNEITAAETKRLLFTLAADSMKGRDSDHKGYFKAAQFVTDYFATHSILPHYPNYQDTLSTKGVKSYNVVGQIGTYDPKKKTVLIGAHLDHVGIRGTEGDTIYNGANDNATGSTAVLQIGKFLAQFDWDQNILLALFADEEKGLRGAYHLAQRFKEEGVSLEYMVNFEMLGTTLTSGSNQVYMTGYNYSNMPQQMNAIAPNFVQFLPQAKALNLFMRSDNYAFYKALSTPAFTLSSFDFKNFDFYHKAGDEAEKLEVENMNQIISTAAFTLAKMLHQKTVITLTPEAQEAPIEKK